jgi:hypothetical protein
MNTNIPIAIQLVAGLKKENNDKVQKILKANRI